MPGIDTSGSRGHVPPSLKKRARVSVIGTKRPSSCRHPPAVPVPPRDEIVAHLPALSMPTRAPAVPAWYCAPVSRSRSTKGRVWLPTWQYARKEVTAATESKENWEGGSCRAYMPWKDRIIAVKSIEAGEESSKRTAEMLARRARTSKPKGLWENSVKGFAKTALQRNWAKFSKTSMIILLRITR